MALTAYIPQSLTFDGQPLPGVMVVTLYNPQGPQAIAGLTGSTPLVLGQTGRLELVGTHRQETWRVTIPRATVINKTGFGCELAMTADPGTLADATTANSLLQAECLARHEGPTPTHRDGVEEKFAIR